MEFNKKPDYYFFFSYQIQIVCFKRGASWPWSFGMARSTTLCDQVCQWFATGWCFSPCSPVSSTNKTDRHNMTEILLNTIKPNQANQNILIHFTCFWSIKPCDNWFYFNSRKCNVYLRKCSAPKYNCKKHTYSVQSYMKSTYFWEKKKYKWYIH